jgi:ketosteroid isomerase-like protein
MSKLSAAIALSLLVSGCATLLVSGQEGDALIQRDREWAALAAQGRDVERIVGFWTEDATVFPPSAPALHGKAAIRDYVQKSLAIPGFQIQWRPASAATSEDGTLGYTTGENAVTVPGPDGKLITIAGRYTTIWRRDRGGDWKCVIDIWNSGP